MYSLAEVLMKRFCSSLVFLPALVIPFVLLAPPARADEPAPARSPAPVVAYGPSRVALDVPRYAPPGYHYEQKRFLAPILGGGVTLGVGWAASAVTGLIGKIITMGISDGGPGTEFGPMFVPLVGPFITLGLQPANQRSDGFTAAAVVMGGGQIVGASLLIAGLAMGKQTVLVEDEPLDDLSFSVVPVVGNTLNGMMIQGTF
jgi:hypothetical protein